MPIVIVKGSDGTKKKPLLKCSSSEQLLLDLAVSANGSLNSPPPTKRSSNVTSFTSNQQNLSNNQDSTTQGIVGDMTDILDFKLYRIVKPSFYEPVSRTILVGGDLFYNKEELSKVLRTAGDEEETEKMPIIVNTKPSVLQKIREMKYTAKKQNTVHRNQKDILTHVKAATERAKQVKSGHSLGAHLELPSAEMTVDWAVNYVAVNEANLVDQFIQFDTKIKDFDRQQQQAQISAHATTFNAVSRLAEATLDGLEAIPHPNQRTSPHRTRDHSKNSHPPTGAPSNVKPLSLAVQLENLKLSGTDAFVSNIISPQAPTAPSSRKSVDISHMPQMHRRNSKSSLGVNFSSNTKDSSGAGEGHQVHGLSTISEPGGKSHAPPPRKVPSSSSGGGSHSHSHRVVRTGNHSVATGARHVEVLLCSEEDSSRPSTAQDPSTLVAQVPSGTCPPVQFNRGRARTRTNSNMDVGNDDDEDVDEDSPRSPSPVKQSGPQSTTTGAKRPIKSKTSPTLRVASHAAASNRVYSNVSVVTPQAPVIGAPLTGTTKDTNTLQELMASQRIFKQSMSYSNNLYESVTDRTKQLQEVIEAKLKRGNRGGQRIVRQWMSFRGIHAQQRQTANEVCQNKEFFRALETLENLNCFQMDGYDRNDENNKLGVNATKDIKYMRKNAVINSQQKIMSRLLSAKWFCAIVSKTRDYMKRMNNNIPICCIKFLTIFQYLLSYDYPLTVELFYRVLESSIVIKEDHIRNIVHVVVRAARDALKISPQDFLLYLESRGIQPCPELLNQVRSLAAAALSQNQSRQHSPRSARQTPQSQSQSHSQSEGQINNRGGVLQTDDDGLAFSFSGLTPRGVMGDTVMEGTEPAMTAVVESESENIAQVDGGDVLTADVEG